MLGNLSDDNKEKDKKDSDRTTSLDMDFENEPVISEGDQKDYRIPKTKSSSNESNAQSTSFWGKSENINSLDRENPDIEATRVPQRQRADIQRSNDKTEDEQMDFGLQTAKVTRINRLKNNVRRWENIIEVLPFWRIAYNPINITFAILTAIFVSLLVVINYNTLDQNQIILFYSQVDQTRVLVPKVAIVLIPIAVMVFETVILRLQRLIFDFDRRLSNVIAASQIFFNIMLIIAMLQIMSLMLN